MLTGLLLGALSCGALMAFENRKRNNLAVEAAYIVGMNMSIIAISGLVGGLVL
jgi:hypothetical protein